MRLEHVARSDGRAALYFRTADKATVDGGQPCGLDIEAQSMSASTPSAVQSQRLIVVELLSNRGTYGKSQKSGSRGRDPVVTVRALPLLPPRHGAQIKAESGGGTLLCDSVLTID